MFLNVMGRGESPPCSIKNITDDNHAVSAAWVIDLRSLYLFGLFVLFDLLSWRIGLGTGFGEVGVRLGFGLVVDVDQLDRKSTRLNSSHTS